ncbi:MAG: hypothetical protein GX146_08935 [Myxococcales bacterium]|jgi:hypothetical protein|nr:hypothetical protein [Myxococcales bacterium]
MHHKILCLCVGWALCLALLLPQPLRALEVAEKEAAPPPDDNYTLPNAPITDRVVNVHTAATTRKGALTLVIDHRAHKTFLSGKDAWFDYLGLDAAGMKIGLGLRYGILDFLDAGLYRLSSGRDDFDVYEFDVKARFLQQDDHWFNAALRTGFTWFVRPGVRDTMGFYSQLLVDHRFFRCLKIGTGLAFHTASANDEKRLSDESVSAAVLAHLEWRPIRQFSIGAELAANVAGYASRYPDFAFSARFLTYRHAFALVVANTQYMSADGITTNSWRHWDELVFGFQILREFTIVK